MSLIESTTALMRHAIELFADSAKEETARQALARIDGPLRVAIAGKVKAGKSTLLNALVGEELAPTDAGECTKVVTWYQNGLTYAATLYPTDGEPTHARFTREGGAIDVDLGGRSPSEIDRLVIDWPTSSLKEMTLIDTPGIASISTDISERTHAFLAPDDEQPTEADAVLYLMRHLHGSDVHFLESFHDDDVAQATPINAIGVLSRADEVGSGRIDAMESAGRIAERYRSDPHLRRLCQTVVPVAGLLGQAGSSLTESEFKALARIASAPETDAAALLLSVDRLATAETPIELLPVERQHLLDRLGLFGVRLATHLIASGRATTAGSLASALVAESGIDELKHVLLVQFARRRDVLKARTALLVLDTLLQDETSADAVRLAADVEEVQARAHEFAELRLLNLLRTGAVKLRADDVPEVERLIGASGAEITDRLDLAPDTERSVIQEAVTSAIGKWQRRAEHPMATRQQAEAARVVVRSCEGMLAELFAAD